MKTFKETVISGLGEAVLILLFLIILMFVSCTSYESGFDRGQQLKRFELRCENVKAVIVADTLCIVGDSVITSIGRERR